ncbi:MAG: sodium:proton antiporter [Synergistaceae bacterium]|jgi:multicomponent Na+:H+ antiporter subunit B|nr:sodium:proton antiporter [Synergistaceae bacterium]
MKPLSVVVTSICDVFAWFMIVFGVYVINNGHNTPGGGFQGGAIVATFLSFMLVAHGGKRFFAWARTGVYGFLEFMGLVAFFTLGCFGFPRSFFFNSLAIPLGGKVLSEWIPYSGTIALMNVAVGLEVVGALSLVVIEMYESIHMIDTGTGMGGERGHDRFDR